MCYKAPGPRCSAHAKKIFDERKKVFIQNPTMDNWDSLMDARDQYDMTPAGQQELEEQIAKQPNSSVLRTRLEKGKEARKLALAAISAVDQGDTSADANKEHDKGARNIKSPTGTKPAASKTAQAYERTLLDTFSPGTSFNMEGRRLVVEGAGKPIPHAGRQGEPKTDVFVLARDADTGEPVQIKISYKRENADFLENKMTAERFYSIVGNDKTAMDAIREAAHARFGGKVLGPETKTINGEEEIVYTLGYRADLVNKGGRNTIPWNPSHEEIMDIYAGTTLSPEKRHSIVPGLNGGKPIKNSGVASHILVSDKLDDVQEVADNLVPIESYVKQNPTVYFSLRAVNFRQKADKWDSNRPLMYHVNWTKKDDGTISGEVDLFKPFQHRANAVGQEVRGMLG